jgi:hypothetical protein
MYVCSWLYWLDENNGDWTTGMTVMRAHMSGDASTITSLKSAMGLTSSVTFYALALDMLHETIYYAGYYNRSVRLGKSRFDGTNQTKLNLPASALQSPGAVAVFRVSVDDLL